MRREHKGGGDDRQPRAIDGVQTGSTAPVSLSPNCHITRVLYLFNTRPGRGGVPATITRVIISAGGSDGVPSSFPHRGTIRPHCGRAKVGRFHARWGEHDTYFSQFVPAIRNKGEGGPSSSEDDSYGLLVQTGRTTFVETESIDGIIFRDPRRISSDSTNPSLLLII